MPFWLEASYFSQRKLKKVSIFVGPFDSDMAAESYAREKVIPEPNPEYKVHFSQHSNRESARREVIFDNSGEQGLDDSLHPYYKEAQ